MDDGIDFVATSDKSDDEQEQTPEPEIIVREVKSKPKRNISEAQREKAREAMKLANERRMYYRQVRQELGLGARDPIPEKYKKETAAYKPLVYEEKKDKQIVKSDEVKELKQESKAKKDQAMKRKAQGITTKQDEIKREAKEARIAKVVRDEMNSILTHRSAMKAHLKMEMDAEKKKPNQDQHADTTEKAKPKRETKKFRLSDGRYIEI